MIDVSKIPPSRQRPGTFPYMVQQPPRPLYPADRPVTPRENYLCVLRGELPYWMPVWLTDTQYCWPDVMQEHSLWEEDGLDWWGQEWVWEPTSHGLMPKPDNRVITDITKWREQIKVPDFADVDWESDAALQTARYDPDRCHLFHCAAGIFERLHELMTMVDAMVAMYEEPEAVHDFNEMMVGYKTHLLGLIFKHYDPVDYIIYGDDWGTQRAGFFSNDMFQEFLMPYTKRVWDFVHSQGKYIELHSCGKTEQYIEEILEMGADAWTPQGVNNLDNLTAKYGDRIALTVSIPGLRNAKTEAEVRACIRSFVNDYAPRGHRVVAGSLSVPKELMHAAQEELYYESAAYYAKVRESREKK